jgi:hypothetical protein
MKLSSITILHLGKIFAITSFLTYSSHSLGSKLPSIVDDFSHVKSNALGITRQFVDDKMVGGNTQTNINVSGGILHIKGEIVPPRGQPGWASSVILLNSEGLPQDVSHFEGVRILLKVNNGNISVSANSTEVTNFDYHAAFVSVNSDGEFYEVNIPFTTMKRAWSEQTLLNTKTIGSLSIVAFGIQKEFFDFEIDEVGFY